MKSRCNPKIPHMGVALTTLSCQSMSCWGRLEGQGVGDQASRELKNLLIDYFLDAECCKGVFTGDHIHATRELRVVLSHLSCRPSVIKCSSKSGLRHTHGQIELYGIQLKHFGPP